MDFSIKDHGVWHEREKLCIKNKGYLDFLRLNSMTLDRKIWEKAQSMYENGHSLLEIKKRTGADQSGVLRRAKKEGWQKSLKKTPFCAKDLKGELPENALEFISNFDNGREISDQHIKTRAMDVQNELLLLVKLACVNMRQFLAAHPNGLYIKKEAVNSKGSKSIHYGLTSEIINPLASILKVCAELTRENSQIASNRDPQIDNNIPISIEFVGV